MVSTRFFCQSARLRYSCKSQASLSKAQQRFCSNQPAFANRGDAFAGIKPRKRRNQSKLCSTAHSYVRAKNLISNNGLACAKSGQCLFCNQNFLQKLKSRRKGSRAFFLGCKNFFFGEIRRSGTLLPLEKIPKSVAYVILFLAGYRRENRKSKHCRRHTLSNGK